MSFWKSRADRQDRYRRELFTGVISAVNADGTYDVLLPGSDEAVRGVANAAGVRFQVGNRVVVHRLAGREAWQLYAAVGSAAPTGYTDPGALIDPQPLVYWGALARTAADPTTVTGYLDGYVDQPVRTTDAPTFAGLRITGTLRADGLYTQTPAANPPGLRHAGGLWQYAHDGLTWHTLGVPTPAGTSMQLQYNDNGTLAAAELYYDKTNKRLGVGTREPGAVLDVQHTGITNPSSSWLFDAGIHALFRKENANCFVGLQAANNSSALRGVISGTRSRGNFAQPLALQDGDSVFLLLGSGFDSAGFLNSAGIEFYVDGNVYPGNLPQQIVIATGINGVRQKRLSIRSNGRVQINNIVSNARFSVQAESGQSIAEYLNNNGVCVASVDLLGTIQACGYKAGDGSIGVSISQKIITPNGEKTLTIKNGIITNVS